MSTVHSARITHHHALGCYAWPLPSASLISIAAPRAALAAGSSPTPGRACQPEARREASGRLLLPQLLPLLLPTMSAPMTSEAIAAAIVADGVAVVPILSPAECAALRAATERCLDAPGFPAEQEGGMVNIFFLPEKERLVTGNPEVYRCAAATTRRAPEVCSSAASGRREAGGEGKA